jgi:enoyl-CoA hydratase
MKFIKLTKEQFIADVRINHEPANALSTHVLQELALLFDQLEVDQDVRVIILRGEGRFFSAGADIKEFIDVPSGKEFSVLSEAGQTLFERIETFTKPVIAVIRGAALGGGLELAMSCHLRLVAADAKLGLPELQLGIIPGFGGTQRLPKYVGKARALEMMLTSEPILGDEAVELGLANHVYPEETLVVEAKKLAAKFAAKSPLSVKAIISLLNVGEKSSYQEGIKQESAWFGEAFESADAKEGISAFLEKRKPNFIGK